MTINEIQEQIIEEFSVFDEWLDKYDYLIDLSKNMPVIAEEYKTNDNLIKGCQSRVWLHADLQGDIVHFSADSDAIITRGIIALLIRVINDKKPAEIANADLYFIDQIGLKQNLSPTRSNGLVSMVKKIKTYSLAYEHKLSKE